MSRVIIRKADESDIETINELNLEMHNSLAESVGLRFSKEELEEAIDKDDLPENNYHVAVVDEKVAGFVAFGKEIFEDEWYGKYVYLYEIDVSEDYRGRGIGSELFGIVLDYAEKNESNIRIGTIIKSEKTINFYKKLGFKPLKVDFIFDLNERLKL